MIHKVLLPGIYTTNGNGVRRCLQYDSNTSKMDILVRESIQNSYDALKDDADSLNIHFNFGSFNTVELAYELDGIHNKLIERYPGKSDYLEIRDMETVGLDGPLESRVIEEYGNLIKLVYSHAEKQQGKEKGGSWGYGKTNYFNFGIGLVIFYTRTSHFNQYQDRLVVSLVEDIDYRNEMLFPDAQLGVSYWGNEGIEDKERAIPITDSGYIRSFLNIFGLEPYPDDCTGTSIIIPFIDKEKLSNEMYSAVFQNNIPDIGPEGFRYFTELCVQRWYFPRLVNDIGGKPLRFFYNGEMLGDSRIEPLFKFMRDLYNESIIGGNEVFSNSSILQSKTVVARYVSRIGKLKQLSLKYGMTIYEALELIHDSNKPNLPIGFRCRKLGMINKYDLGEGIVAQATPCNPDEYQIVGLHPIDNVPIVDESTKEVLGTLEMYIRMGENPSHTVWKDISLYDFCHADSRKVPRLISKMIGDVARQFSNKDSRESHTATRNRGLSRKLGQMFLPSHGFGVGSSPKTSTGSGNIGKPTVRKPRAGVDKPVITRTGGIVTLTVPLNLKDGKTSHVLSLSPPVSEIGNFKTIEDWESNCGVRLPIHIKQFRIISLNGESINPPLVMSKVDLYFRGQYMFEPSGSDGDFRSLKMVHDSSLESLTLSVDVDCGNSPFRFGMSVRGCDTDE